MLDPAYQKPPMRPQYKPLTPAVYLRAYGLYTEWRRNRTWKQTDAQVIRAKTRAHSKRVARAARNLAWVLPGGPWAS